MLAGNINIIRISSRTNAQMDLILTVVNELCADRRFKEVTSRFVIVRYEHSEEITGYFSSLCDMRVIWGGDETVGAIRKIPIRPTASELTFADKFSLCVIKADTFIRDARKDEIVGNFYNDAYWFGQLACSSPRLVVWVGKDRDIEEARTIFWHMLEHKVLRKRPEIGVASAVDKLVAEYSMAILGGTIKIEKSNTSLVNRVLLLSGKNLRRDMHCGGGLFYEIKLDTIDQLGDMITRKDQTLSILGFDRDEIIDFLSRNKPDGIDRFVSIGRSLNFSATWDGHDLLREFCREIELDIHEG
jgi:hypothetical protein